MAKLRDSKGTGSSEAGDDDSKLAGILFTGQGQYAFRKKGVGSRTSEQEGEYKSKKSFDPLSIAECFNFGDPNHKVKQCPKKLDTVRAAKSKLEYMAKKTGMNRNAHTVFYTLCRQIDHEKSEDDIHNANTDSEDIDDQELFDALM